MGIMVVAVVLACTLYALASQVGADEHGTPKSSAAQTLKV
jgi:hypothetical protein